MPYSIAFYNILTGELGGTYTEIKNVNMSAKELNGNTYFVQAPRRCNFTLLRDNFLDIFFEPDNRKGDLSHYKAVVLYNNESIFEGLIKFPVKYTKKTNEVRFTCYDYSILLNKIADTKKTVFAEVGYNIKSILEEILQSAQHYFDDSITIFDYELDYHSFANIPDSAHILETLYSDFHAEILDYNLLTIIRNIGFYWDESAENVVLEMYEHRHYKDDFGNNIFSNIVKRLHFENGEFIGSSQITSETSWGVFSGTIVVNPAKTYLDDNNAIYALTEDYSWVLYAVDSIFFDNIKFRDTEYSYNQLLKLILIINDLALYCENNTLKIVNKNTYNDLPAIEITQGFLSKGPDAIIYNKPDYNFISDMVLGGANWSGEDLANVVKSYYNTFFENVYLEISGEIALWVNSAYEGLELGKRFKYDGIYYKVMSINKDYVKNTIKIKAYNTLSDTYLPDVEEEEE